MFLLLNSAESHLWCKAKLCPMYHKLPTISRDLELMSQKPSISHSMPLCLCGMGKQLAQWFSAKGGKEVYSKPSLLTALTDLALSAQTFRLFVHLTFPFSSLRVYLTGDWEIKSFHCNFMSTNLTPLRAMGALLLIFLRPSFHTFLLTE